MTSLLNEHWWCLEMRCKVGHPQNRLILSRIPIALRIKTTSHKTHTTASSHVRQFCTHSPLLTHIARLVPPPGCRCPVSGNLCVWHHLITGITTPLCHSALRIDLLLYPIKHHESPGNYTLYSYNLASFFWMSQSSKNWSSMEPGLRLETALYWMLEASISRGQDMVSGIAN